MPIKPENRARYPADWPLVRERILQRAQLRCEHPGCGARQYDIGFWRMVDGQWQWLEFERGLPTYSEAKQAAAEHHFARYGDELTPRGEGKIIVIVLTIAHLDHTPENCADDNLRALCQRHHLAHDHAHHQANAQATRRAKAGTLELF